MNAHSRRRPDLNTLVISLKSEGPSRPGRVTFELFVRGAEAATVAMSCGEIGFPDASADLSREYRYREPRFSVPAGVTRELRAGLAARAAPAEPLWLELNPPGCSLTFVPWERLLQPRLGVPVLRSSFFQSGGAFPRSDWLDVVLCASAPVAKGAMPVPELVGDFAGSVLGTRPGGTTIHVFTDRGSYGRLRQSLPNQVGGAGEHGVRLYDPETAAGYKPAERSRELRDEPRKVINPWLAWMTDALGGRPVDAVQFICHGLIYLDQGALALSESPCINEDTRLARFIGARQLNAFLDRAGATGVAFTSPPHNFSVLGLRVLHEQLARIRPGTSLLHEHAADRDFGALGAAYRALYDGGGPPPSRAVSLYCTPAALGRGGDNRARGPGEVLGGHTGQEVSKEEGVWVSSGMRWIERTASQLGEAAGGGTGGQTSTAEGIEEALKFVSDVLERHRQKR